VGVAALSGWDISHLAVRGGGKAVIWMASLLCRTALKSSQSQHPYICSAHQSLDTAGLLSGRITAAKLKICAASEPLPRDGGVRRNFLVSKYSLYLFGFALVFLSWLGCLFNCLPILKVM